MATKTLASDEYLIREAKEPELKEVGEVTYQGFDHHLPGADAPSPERAELLLDAAVRAREGILLVAVQPSSGILVGTATLLRSGSKLSRQARPGEYELRLLAVHPLARRSGLGWKLLKSSADLAAAAGARRLVLDTAVDNHRAQALYVKYGFVRRPERETPRPAPKVQLAVYTLDFYTQEKVA
ncbi:GNAT family acetyltransferase [Arthrobacter alpinus]|uniref:GNAT family N-acetyltransferase n=1 Tax=Arthrobacter alpinus TaxID=656366 RepID=UPI0005CA0506|nr:GNAT family N-acetyltransferase [Arthrobacter alpinus]ALV45270.1 GNAT family acetyltransferase [Arthrobacter alpinus]